MHAPGYGRSDRSAVLLTALNAERQKLNQHIRHVAAPSALLAGAGQRLLWPDSLKGQTAVSYPGLTVVSGELATDPAIMTVTANSAPGWHSHTLHERSSV